MDPCKEREPRVITTKLIERCIEEQVPKGEAGRLAREEGIPLDEVKHIRLEFLNILKIDHVWVLPALTKLSLNNNYIEYIENLETLVNLKELDLSFNKIPKIENLEVLVKLEKLSLFDNLITELENMDTLVELTIFSIGRNYISDTDNVLYLRRFEKLTSLNMAENPCAETENFRYFVAVFLPQVIYYEYRSIKELEKELGAETFRRELQKLEEDEERERSTREEEQMQKRDAELHSLAFVEYLNSRFLFDKLFENDEEGKTLLDIGEEAEDLYAEYEEQFIALCHKAFECGQSHYEIRRAEVENFMKTVEDAKKDMQQQSIACMESFLENKAEIFYTLKSFQDQYENMDIDIDVFNQGLDECSNNFNDKIRETWKILMKLELELFEQMEDVNQTAEHNLGELINAFLEEIQAIFSNLRALEITYMENISESAGRFLTTMNITENIQISERLHKIMIDRETISNAVATTHDHHMQVIDSREDTLISRAKHWLETLVTNLQKDEIARNRSKILEINHFLDIQREEFEELQEVHTGLLQDSTSDIMI